MQRITRPARPLSAAGALLCALALAPGAAAEARLLPAFSSWETEGTSEFGMADLVRFWMIRYSTRNLSFLLFGLPSSSRWKQRFSYQGDAGLQIRSTSNPFTSYSYIGLVLGCIDADLCKYIVHTHFSAFFEICKMRILLHRSNLSK